MLNACLVRKGLLLIRSETESSRILHTQTTLILMTVSCSIWLLLLAELVIFVEGKDRELLALDLPNFSFLLLQVLHSKQM